MRKLLSVMSGVLVVLVFGVSVSAQEITPDPSSYDYGATSEYSVSRQIGDVSEDQNGLADTGQSAQAPLLIAGGVLLAAAMIVVLRNQKQLVKR